MNAKIRFCRCSDPHHPGEAAAIGTGDSHPAPSDIR